MTECKGIPLQGLANLYEKNRQTDFKSELPVVYQKLIALYER